MPGAVMKALMRLETFAACVSVKPPPKKAADWLSPVELGTVQVPVLPKRIKVAEQVAVCAGKIVHRANGKRSAISTYTINRSAFRQR
jgi:hypothetical protein